MNNFVGNLLEQIFADFKNHVDSFDCLEVLTNNSFQNITIDYSIPIVRLYYLLKYFPAYAAEYYYAFENHLPYDIEQPYNAISVGCGCGTDYYSLHFATRDQLRQAAQRIHYTGLDRIDWPFKQRFPSDDVRFIINESLSNTLYADRPYNIVIFPRSLRDLDQLQLQFFIDNITTNNLLSDKVFVISFNTGRGDEIEKMNHIVSQIRIANGHNETIVPQKQTSIYSLRELCPRAFEYQPHISDYFLKINELCQEFKQNGQNCNHRCKQHLNQNPALLAKIINYDLRILEK